MSTFRGTAGPWKASQPDQGKCRVIVSDAPHWSFACSPQVAQIYGNGDAYTDMTDANAALIAAAPVMLEALLAGEEALSEYTSTCEALDAMRAILAVLRAEGAL